MPIYTNYLASFLENHVVKMENIISILKLPLGKEAKITPYHSECTDANDGQEPQHHFPKGPRSHNTDDRCQK